MIKKETHFNHGELDAMLQKELDAKYGTEMIPSKDFAELIDGMDLRTTLLIFNRYVKDPVVRKLSGKIVA